MTNSLFTLEIVTPECIVFSAEASYVTAPGSEGEFGVLPQHAPFITTLRHGIIQVQAVDKKRHFFVTSGFAEVVATKVTILADEAFDLNNSATIPYAENRLSQAQSALDHAASDEKQDACKHAIEVAKSMYQAAKDFSA